MQSLNVVIVARDIRVIGIGLFAPDKRFSVLDGWIIFIDAPFLVEGGKKPFPEGEFSRWAWIYWRWTVFLLTSRFNSVVLTRRLVLLSEFVCRQCCLFLFGVLPLNTSQPKSSFVPSEAILAHQVGYFIENTFLDILLILIIKPHGIFVFHVSIFLVNNLLFYGLFKVKFLQIFWILDCRNPLMINQSFLWLKKLFFRHHFCVHVRIAARLLGFDQLFLILFSSCQPISFWNLWFLLFYLLYLTLFLLNFFNLLNFTANLSQFLTILNFNPWHPYVLSPLITLFLLYSSFLNLNLILIRDFYLTLLVLIWI